MAAPTKKTEKAEAPAKVKTERHCPSCGKLHGSSLIPAAEVGIYAVGERLALLQDEGTERYRVFYCDGRHLVVAHHEEEE